MSALFLRLAVLPLYLAWSLLVLFPDPSLLIRSIPRAMNPQVDPEAVREWARTAPDDPALIEQMVLKEYVLYSVPWQTRGVPWYFPTTREVVETGRGDCQARMLVLASILEAKQIPYTLSASLDHIWVEYPHKQPTALESAQIAIMNNTGDGSRLQLPAKWDWRESWRIEREYFWDYMPGSRKLLLVHGLVLIFFRRRWLPGLQALWDRLHWLWSDGGRSGSEPAYAAIPTSQSIVTDGESREPR
ncbi:MAG: transglutaminase domain-containing protein [Chloroflexia bacterium]